MHYIITIVMQRSRAAAGCSIVRTQYTLENLRTCNNDVTINFNATVHIHCDTATTCAVRMSVRTRMPYTYITRCTVRLCR